MRKTKVGTKGEITRLKILNAAIFCLGRFGERQTTFQKIADQCKVSQPLVVHYFKKHENIFPTVLQYLLDVSLKETEEAMSGAVSAPDKLKAYLQVSVAFLRRQPELGRIYVLFYYLSAYETQYLRSNARLKQEAIARISGILKQGQEEGIFKLSDLRLAAKTIHDNLTGLILNRLTDSDDFTDRELIDDLFRNTLKSIKD